MKNEPRLFAARYQILEQIAGGTSIVWKAHDPHIGRLVAIKTPSDVVMATPSMYERFVEEARLLGRLNHPGIVRILHLYEKGEVDERCHLISEWLDENLAALVTRTDVDWRDKYHVMRRVLDAVEYLHSQGLVHRDLKPGNVLLSHDLSEVRVADLGIAAAAGASIHTARATFKYVAPDSLDVNRASQSQVDIYSLGITFFEVFAGESGFAAAFEEIFRAGSGADGDVRWLNWHLDGSRKLPDLREFDAEIPATLAGVIARMAEKNVALRFKDIAEIKTALRPLELQLRGDEQCLLPMEPEDFAKRKPAQRRPLSKQALVGLSIAGFIVLALGIIVIPELFGSPSHGAQSPTVVRLQAAVRAAEKVQMPPDIAALVNAKELLARNDARKQPELEQATHRLRDAIATAPRLGVLGSTPQEVEQILQDCAARGGGCKHREFDDETRRTVRLEPFELDTTEISNSDFAKFVAATRWSTDAERSGFVARWQRDFSVKVPGSNWQVLAAEYAAADRAAMPVRGVSFRDAEQYCKWAGMRLPTEDEWEYAAQGGESSNAGIPALQPASSASVSGRFGSKGLDGSVWEWTAPTLDPSGPAVLKGGSWLEQEPARRRSAARRLQERTLAHTDDGFRCAKNSPHWPERQAATPAPP